MPNPGGGILQLKSQSAKINAKSGGGYSATEKSQSTKIYLNMNFPGGGYSATEKSQSTKIYLNMNFPGGGGYSATKKSKCQD